MSSKISNLFVTISIVGKTRVDNKILAAQNHLKIALGRGSWVSRNSIIGMTRNAALLYLVWENRESRGETGAIHVSWFFSFVRTSCPNKRGLRSRVPHT
jgi:hypothetical protein